MRIRESLARSADDIRNGRAPTPRWLLVGANVAVPALLLVLLAVAVLGGGRGGFDPQAALQAGPPPPAPTVPDASPTATPTGEPADDQDLSPVVLPGVTGQQVEVPAVTVDLARRGTLASFTGNTDGIVGTGDAPDYAADHPDATIADATVRFATPTSVGFVVPVDPDGPGPDATVNVDATVVERDGRWLFSW